MWWFAAAWGAEVRPGDVVFHRSRTEQAEFIAIATRSPWTHVGIVFERGGELVVLEAGDPVGYTPFATWAARSADGRIGIRRRAGLTPEVVDRLADHGSAWVGRRYDAAFAWTDD